MLAPAQGSPCRYRSGFLEGTYYEILEPLDATDRAPVLMIAGGAHSAACYLATADERPGWAHDFVAAGYPVVLVDWPGVGRSGTITPAEYHGSQRMVDGIAQILCSLDQPATVMTHSISGAFGWKLIEQHGDHIARLIGVAPASPGNMGKHLGELVWEDGPIRVVSMPSGEVEIDLRKPLDLDAGFARRKLVGSSSRFPADAFGAYFATLLAVPGRITYERTNIGDAQLRIEGFTAFMNKPVLIVTPTNDIDHPRALDGEIVTWLTQAGAHAEQLYLGDINITGNGHMAMLETNSDAIARAMIAWIERS